MTVITLPPPPQPVCDWCSDPLPDVPEGGMCLSDALCHDCWKDAVEGAPDSERHLLRPCPPHIGLETWIRSMWATPTRSA